MVSDFQFGILDTARIYRALDKRDYLMIIFLISH